MTPGVSRGIIECLDAGVLTATSVMTTSQWWPDHAAALARFTDRADIGLHLNLTLGAPLGPMPALAPSGRLPGIDALMKLGRAGALPLAEIASEIELQADRFQAVFGRPPDHVDGHQHVHILGPVRSLLLKTLTKRAWRPWLRDSADRPLRILRRGVTLTKALGLATLGRHFHRDARRERFVVNDGFAGFSSFREADDYGHLFSRYLVAPGRRHLVMCHPGIVDEELRLLDPVVATREQELAFLLSPRFKSVLAQHGASVERLHRGAT